MSPLASKIANFTGFIIAISAIFYVGYQLSEYGDQISFYKFSITQWASILVLAIVYALANSFLAFAWKSILKSFLVTISQACALKIFGLSQLAKYLPGNIFHLAGRQALGMAHGISGIALVKSAIWELGLIATVGSLFAILVIPLTYPTLNQFLFNSLFIFVIAIFGWIVSKSLSREILIAYILYLIFLIISGAIFAGIVTLISDSTYAINYVYVVSAFVIAWIAGLFTPGAPAGIGVRELVLLFLLKGMIADADILLAVVIGRLVTVVGDLFFYLYALTIKIKTVVID